MLRFQFWETSFSRRRQVTPCSTQVAMDVCEVTTLGILDQALQIHEYAQVRDISGILDVRYVSLVGEFSKSGVLFGRSPY